MQLCGHRVDARPASLLVCVDPAGAVRLISSPDMASTVQELRPRRPLQGTARVIRLGLHPR